MREWSAYSLDIEIEQASGTVVLRLDESIRVKELQVDQASVSYQRVDDELILDAPTDRFVLHIEALGRVSYFVLPVPEVFIPPFPVVVYRPTLLFCRPSAE